MMADRLNGPTITMSDIRDFEKCVADKDLIQVKTTGSYYTWSNNQEVPVSSRIDWCFANLSWVNQFPMLTAEILERNVSDHNPILLNFDTSNVKKSKPFRFLNVLAEHDHFGRIVKECWKYKMHHIPLLVS